MLTSIKSRKSYIGQTTRPIEKRLEEHETGRSNGCRAIYNAIQYHGWDKFEKDYYECPDEDLDKHEELMIEVLGTLAPGGYNLKEGGDNRKMSGETKQKMSESHLGKKLSEETKQKLSKLRLGDKNHMWGKPKSEETKQRHSEAILGEKHYKSKRVYQYDLEGNFLGSFGSTEEAGRHLKKGGTNIRACARGDRKTAYEFKWSYTKS
jgi:group I intron endonuclease